MPVDSGPVNSILNAYFTGRQIRQQQEAGQRDAEMQQARIQQMKFEQQIQAQEEARQQKQLDLYKTFQEQEMAHKTAQLEAQRQENLFKAHQQVIQDTASGLINPSGEPIGSKIGGGTINAPGSSKVNVGGQNFDVSQVIPFEELQKRATMMKFLEGQIAAQTEGAKAGAKAQAEAAFKKAEQEQKDKAEMERIQVTNEGRLRVANINAASRRYAADKSHEIDPQATSDLATLGWFGQSGRPLLNSKGDLAAKRVILANGGVPLDTKVPEQLGKAHDTDVLYDQMKAFIDKLPDGALGANFQKYITQNPMIMNEYSNMNSMTSGYAGQIAREFGRETGRLTNQDIERAKNILVTPGITKDMALKRLQVLKGVTSSNIINGILSGVPEKQRIDVLSHFGHNPTDITTPDGKGGFLRKYVKTPEGKWEYFDPMSGTYKLVVEK